MKSNAQRKSSIHSDNLLDSYVEHFQLFSSPGPTNKRISGVAADLHSFRFSPPPFPQSCAMSSPLLPSMSSRSPSVPVDVRSVSRVRKISTTKLAYSYTFGSNNDWPSSPSSLGKKRKRSEN